MFKAVFVVCIFALSNQCFSKTIVDLMKEGRFREAKQIIDTTAADTRYSLLWYAMQESDGVRACSLYQVISTRYPATDADSLAKERLQQAMNMGMKIKPMAVPETIEQVRLSDTTAIKTDQPPEAIETHATVPADTEIVLSALPFDPVEKESVKTETNPLAQEVNTAAEPISEHQPEIKEQANNPVNAVTATPTPELEIKIEEPKLTQDSEAASVSITKETVQEKVNENAQIKTESPANTPLEPTIKQESSAISGTEATAKKTEIEKTVADKKPEPEKLVANQERKISNAGGHWFIQVGAFGNHDNANRLADKLKNAGYSISLIPRELPDKTLLQVRVGGFQSRENCVSAAAELKEKFELPAVILHD